MKKVFCILLATLLCASLLVACGAPTVPDNTTSATQTAPTIDTATALSDGKTLKVLAVGNSFSDNTTEFLYDIATAEGMTDVVIGRLYISGCTVAMHLENAQSNAPAYEYSKNTSGNWKSIQSATLEYALKDEAWDIITVQQGSSPSGIVETYSGLSDLVSYINDKKSNPNARLVWHMTWAYQVGSTNTAFSKYNNDQMTMYNAICNAVHEAVLPTNAFHSVIPAGTAIQNARTSSLGDNLTRDTYHLNDMGKIIGTYTWYAAFVGKPLEAIHIDNVANKVMLTETDKAIILESVNNAISNPYSVTPSANT